MQTLYRFSFEAPVKLVSGTNKRFIQARRLLDAIRQGVGRAVNDIAQGSLEFGYLVGMETGSGKEGQRIQSASAISKWFVEELNSDHEQTVSGRVCFLLESAALHLNSMVEQLVQMAGMTNNIKLKLLDVTSRQLDYEVTDEPVTYTIDSYLPGLLAPRELRDDREAMKELVKTTYPIGHDPATQRVLSQNCGKALKRHLLENAEQHGLCTDALNSTILIVKAYWIALPFKGGRSSSDRREACRLVFQAPIKLMGNWFAGSYRHKGMGLISEAPGLAKKSKSGVFVL